MRTSPPWLAALLTLATGGLYLMVWAGRSWALMKRVRGEDSMHPVGHALSFAVPFYMVFRAKAHFATLNELLARAGLRERANVPLAVAAFVGIPAALIAGGDPRVGLPPGAPLLLAAACAAFVAGHGQHHLVRLLRARIGSALVTRVHPLEWVALLAAGSAMAGYLGSLWLTGQLAGG